MTKLHNQSLFLIKPDASTRCLRDTIVELILAEGFRILLNRSIQLDEALVRAYQPIMNRPSEFGEGWKREVLAALTGGISVVLVVERADALAAACTLKKRIRTAYAPGEHYLQRVVFNLLHSPDTEEELEINWRALLPDCAALFSQMIPSLINSNGGSSCSVTLS